MKNTFNEDYKIGKEGEHQVRKMLEQKGFTFKYSSDTDYPEQQKLWDLCMMKGDKRYLIEIKTSPIITDKFDTGNFAVEYKCSGKKSGISTSKSDIWVEYFINKSKNNVFFIKTETLKQLIDKNKRNGNIQIVDTRYTTAKLYLIPRSIFNNYYSIYTWNRTNSTLTKGYEDYVVSYTGENTLHDYPDPFNW